jgi:MraZ protein
MILRPSHKYPCIEAWPQAVFDKLAQQLDRYELFSPEYDNLAATIYAEAYPAESDKEGRIIISERLAGHAGISDNVTFMGAGPTFQIWEPEAAKRRTEEARQMVNSSGLTLGGMARPAPAPAGGA